MRGVKLAFTLLAIASTLFAAEPFAGTWKLNSAKSKYKTGEPPKEQTVIIAESGSDLDVTIKGTGADGTPLSVRFTVPAAGGEGKLIESPSSPFDAVSLQRLGPDRQVITYSKEGKVILTNHARVSKDGKTITANIKGTNAEGKPVEGVSIYDRQ